MRKTSEYVTDDEAEGLRRAAAPEGLPQAQLVREGIRRVIAEVDAKPRTFRSFGQGRGGGQPYVRWASADLYRRTMGEG
jgi:hypothetical protein